MDLPAQGHQRSAVDELLPSVHAAQSGQIVAVPETDRVGGQVEPRVAEVLGHELLGHHLPGAIRGEGSVGHRRGGGDVSTGQGTPGKCHRRSVPRFDTCPPGRLRSHSGDAACSAPGPPARMSPMRIAYLPLDEPPVNTDLVRDIATLSGGQLLLPPEELLPNQREAGDADALGEWLRTIIGQEQVDTVVVSVDMLAFGGLIPSRTSADDVREALGRLEVLTSVKQSLPQVPIHGVSLVMRASDSYSAGEEPEYWSSYGRDLHAYGGARHRDFLNRAALVDDQATTAAGQAIPTDVLLDFTHRRLRNHLVNLTAKIGRAHV